MEGVDSRGIPLSQFTLFRLFSAGRLGKARTIDLRVAYSNSSLTTERLRRGPAFSGSNEKHIEQQDKFCLPIMSVTSLPSSDLCCLKCPSVDLKQVAVPAQILEIASFDVGQLSPAQT